MIADKPQIKLSSTVVLMDVAFLNFVINDVKRYFEQALQRPLQDIDVSMLTTYMMLDAGMVEEKGEVQFLLVYDEACRQLAHAHPTDLKEELNGVAFQGMGGEYAFASVPCEGMVTRQELFLDLLTIVSDSSDVKNLVVVSFNEEYGPQVTEALGKIQGKNVVQFRMDEPETMVEYRWDMLAYPVMRALGIKAEEL